MNIKQEQMQQFDTNFLLLNRNIERIYRHNLDLRNFFTTVLFQLAVIAVFLHAYWFN